MRVVLVSPYDLAVPGGVQSHVVQLAERLRAGGDEVVALGPGSGSTLPPRWSGLGRSLSVPANGSRAPITLSPWAWGRTREAIARLAPDVVHVHEPMVPVVGLAAVSAPDVPIVVTHHAWAARTGGYRLARPVADRVMRHVAVRLAVSPAAASFHARALGLDPTRLRVVPNGIDVARFADPTRDEAPDEIATPWDATVLFVGRLEARKGAEVLLAALRRCWAASLDVGALVIGDGPQRRVLRDALQPEELARFRLLGRVDHATLRACHAAADVFVSPAIGGESFGIVLVEAMAAGTPVIASDLPGHRSVVRSGHDGVLVPPGDAVALAASLRALLGDPARRRTLADTARRTAAGYDWEHVAARIRDVYLEVVAG